LTIETVEDLEAGSDDDVKGGARCAGGVTSGT
jgi:hypothetical protein